MSTEDKFEKIKDIVEKGVDLVRDRVRSIVGENDSSLDQEEIAPPPAAPSAGGENDTPLD